MQGQHIQAKSAGVFAMPAGCHCDFHQGSVITPHLKGHPRELHCPGASLDALSCSILPKRDGMQALWCGFVDNGSI